MPPKPTYEELEQQIIKLKEQILIFQKIAQKSEQSFGMMDLQGNFTYVNPALCRHLGISKPIEAVGKNISLFYPEKHRIKLLNQTLPAVLKEGHWTGELDFVSKNGRVFHTIQNIFLIRDKAQRTSFIAIIVTDITSYRRFNQTLLQEEKLQTLTAVVSEVSHEIRNPLVSIGGFARRLKTKVPDQYECDIILKESERLEKILARVKEYLEPVELRPSECHIGAILDECLMFLSPELAKKQVTYTLNSAHKLPAVFADRHIINQIFISLIRNAKDAMNSGDILKIRTLESEQDIQVEFENHFPHHKLRDTASLFVPFADRQNSKGLPVCFRLLKEMGGLLSFVQKNGSALFTVSIPKQSPLTTASLYGNI